jgi:hypothetical protein
MEKRLQFRHHIELFENRTEAIQYLTNIVDTSHTASTVFGTTLYAEPMVAKYKNEQGDIQVLLAIGSDNGHAPYHIIDTHEIAKLIMDEADRADKAEAHLSATIDEEIRRAKEKEDDIKRALNDEMTRSQNAEQELKEADSRLQEQISDNISSIIKLETPSENNILEEFVLRNSLGEQMGESIKIYKDNSLIGAKVGNKGASDVKIVNGDITLVYKEGEEVEGVEYLYLIYRNEFGVLNLVGIDFESFLREAEIGDGLSVLNNVVSIKLKEGENYLATSKEGLQTVGIDKAIAEMVSIETNRAESSEKEIISTVDKLNETVANEVGRIDTDIQKESDRTTSLEKTTENLDKEIKQNKISSKDVILNETEKGTELTIQTDELTITKKYDTYDSGIAVLSSLLKVKKVEPKNTSIKSRYELQDKEGNLIGDAIELPVESALVSVKQGNIGDEIDTTTGAYKVNGSGDTTMNFVYRLESGKYELTQIIVSEYFTDSHFGRGLNNQDGAVSLLEGDGNEYLVIGEDTIAVVGVKSDIKLAEDNAVSRANAYTDNQISLVTDSIDTLTRTIDTSVASMNDTLNTAVENINDTIQSQINAVEESINSEVSNRESANAEIRASVTALTDSLNNNVNSLQLVDSELRNQINGVDNSINILSGNVAHRIDDVITNLTNDFNQADTKVLEAATSYSEVVGNRVLETIREEKARDVKYDSGNKKIYVEFANGTVSEGFDASDFLVDGTLSDVTFDNVNDEIKFVWNTDAGNKIVNVPLSKFVDQYQVASESVSFLKISQDNKIAAIVDNADGYANTIASTDFVKNYADKTTNNKVESFSASVLNFITSDKAVINERIAQNASEIDRLKGEATVVGSVSYIIDTELERKLVTGGIPVTEVTPEEADRLNSLIRAVSVGGRLKYYVTADASGIMYPTENGEMPLTEYISSLETKIQTLENTVNNLENTIKDVVKSYLTGTENEIKITETDDKLTIGFDDNAIFGEI